MNLADRVQDMRHLTALILEAEQTRLRKLASDRDLTLAQLARMESLPEATGLDPLADARADLAYQRWAEVRRRDLMIVLARQTAEWREAQESLRRAFGRDLAMGRVAAAILKKRQLS